MNQLISKSSDAQREQNVQFHDQQQDWMYTVPSMPDPTYSVVDSTEATLANFFARPIVIGEYLWAQDTPLFETLDPWTAYFTNPRVSNRISNYNMLRAKLCVKVLLNGNGFYYGRAIVAYIPRPGEVIGFPLPRALIAQDLIQLSQMPHVYIDPTTSQGGSMCLPFFHPNNALSIPLGEWTQMGLLQLQDINSLWHALGITEPVNPVSITIMAWAEDVELSIPTSFNAASMTPQMGTDEYSSHPISGPANTIARAAGKLSAIPGISSYAKATQSIASAVSGVASAFGYSRPIVVSDSQTVKPEYVGVIANTNAKDNATKLSLDIKQELTVDPRVVGLGDSDEMTILSIAKRESILTTFDWPFSPSGGSATPLFACSVTPLLFQVDTLPNPGYHMTAMCFAAVPFQYWRGSIKFRFQIVASSFHKGRLRVSYDPYIQAPGTDLETNLNYSHVVDLANERDFTLTVGWGQKSMWLPIPPLNTITPPFPGPVLPVNAFANGTLTVYILNDLTGPSAGDSDHVQVNVFVSAGDDFEVCVPSCGNIAGWSNDPTTGGGGPGARTFEPQSGEMGDTDFTTDESIPVTQTDTGKLADLLPTTDHTLDVFFGDPIVSFRQCLKRYNFSIAWPLSSLEGMSTDPQYVFWYFRFSDFPIFRGGGIGGGVGTIFNQEGTKWNYCKTTLMNYLTPAFCARRGGIRWKYHLDGVATATQTLQVTKSGLREGVLYPAGRPLQSYSPYDFFSARAQQGEEQNPHTWCATHVTDVQNNPVIEIDIPYYNYERFTPARVADVVSPFRQGQTYHVVRAHAKMDPTSDPYLNAYVASAEDFSLHFFVGCPPLYWVTNVDYSD